MQQKTINKKSIVNALRNNFKLPKKYCEETVNGIFNNIQHALNKSQDVNIPNFGTFKVQLKKSRVHKSPLTKQTHVIKQRNVCVFQPSVKLKQQLNKKI